MAEDTFIDRLRTDIEAEIQLLIDVAAFTVKIQDAQEHYRGQRRKIRSSLKKLGLEDPNEWPDLWLWYGRYSDDPEIRTMQDRRELALRTYQPLLEALEGLEERQLGTGMGPPETGWSEVDRQVSQLRQQYATARTPEEYRQVGLLCRDILLSMGYVLFDPDRHLPEGETAPKRGDAKNRIRLAVGGELQGSDHGRLRHLVNATWDFVQPVVHDRTDDQTKAMLAADATIHLVKIMAAIFPKPTGRVPDEDLDEASAELLYDESDWEPDEADLEYLASVPDEEWEPDEDVIPLEEDVPYEEGYE